MFLKRIIEFQLYMTAALTAQAMAQPAGAPACPPLDAIRAEAALATPRDYAVTRDYTDNRGDTRHLRARYDPRRAPAQAWSLEQRNETTPSEKFLRRYKQDLRPPPPSYTRVAAVLKGEVRCIEADESRAVYAVDRLGSGAIQFDGEDISRHFSARLQVDLMADRPYVSEIRFSLEEPFKPQWLVRITRAEGRVAFTRKGSGVPVILLQEFYATGSRPFGSFEYETRSEFSDHAPAAVP